MKWLLLLVMLITSNTVFAQQGFDIELWKKKEGFKKLMPPIQQRDFKGIPDSISNSYKSVTIPNGFITKLPAPKLIGNNIIGHDIYTLRWTICR